MAISEPIRDVTIIDAIKRNLLAQNDIYGYALFVIGINTNLRISDLLRLKLSMLADANIGDEIRFKEKKTQKTRLIVVNRTIYDAVQKVLGLYPDGYPPDMPMFPRIRDRCKRKKSGVKPLLRGQAWIMMKQWFRDVGLDEGYSPHSLRKTWGYHQRVTFGADIGVLTTCFNHSSTRQTLTYLGINAEEVKEAFMREL